MHNPKLLIIPDRLSRADTSQQTGNRALINGAVYKTPDLILGMDTLQLLHVYFAFKEGTLYVTLNNAPSKMPSLSRLDTLLAASPNNPNLLNARCFARGLGKVKLDDALADCEQALKQQPGNSHILDSKGLVLYQLGRYSEALDNYNQALTINPKQAASMLMRGHTKQKLGDAAGGDADIAAAKALNPDVLASFGGSDIAAN